MPSAILSSKSRKARFCSSTKDADRCNERLFFGPSIIAILRARQSGDLHSFKIASSLENVKLRERRLNCIRTLF